MTNGWIRKLKRLEVHGKEYELPPVFKMNALRMLMTGKAKEYFDMWEADRDPTDAGKSYEELLNKEQGIYAKLVSMQQQMQRVTENFLVAPGGED
mgnify:CR=1 FL=1